jgi:hypothetical protein
VQVSVVGDGVSQRRSERVTPELLTAMYETLEPLCYELTATANHRQPGNGGAQRMSPPLISVLMSAIAKVGRSLVCISV